MGQFKIKKKTNLITEPLETIVPESDFSTVLQDGTLVQFEYEEDEILDTYKVKPGIFSIAAEKESLVLQPTEFVKENLLDSFLHTQSISEKVDKFFNKLHIYKQYGIEVPRRGMLLYGPPGSGKSSTIKVISNKYALDNKTLVIIWGTDRINPGDVKDFIKTFEYSGVEKMILIAEDLGGVEVDKVRIESRASLLSLLDNQEKAFRIPTLIMATTNHIEVFQGNLTNRPGRFSDKIEVGLPNGEMRQGLVKFFLKDRATPELLEKIKDRRYNEFSPAHIQELALRADLYDLTLEESLDQLQADIVAYNKAFEKKKKIGIGDYDE